MAFGKRRIPKHLILEPNYPVKKRSALGLSWFALALTVFMVSIVLTAKANASLPEEINSGSLLIKNGDGKFNSPLHLHTTVDAHVNGMLAEVHYSQLFKNDSDEWREGIYVFPLSEASAINHMEMRIGERIIIGEIKEKQEAKRVYEEAKREGKRAALTEQQRPNMFTQKVANIGPGEEVEIRLTYIQKIDFRNSQFEWRLPTTITPRYIPGVPLLPESDNEEIQFFSDPDFGWANATSLVPDAHEITPPMIAEQGGKIRNPVKISVTLDSGLPLSHIDALYHDVVIKKDNGEHHIKLSKSFVEMDRDFVLQWASTNQSTPTAAIFSETTHGEDYAMLMLVPPTDNSLTMALPRDIVFIIDTSGSMQGDSIEQARNSLAAALQRLGKQDRFNIIEFNSNYHPLFSGLQAVDSNSIYMASEWVERLSATGGTEMLPALEAAFRNMDSEERLQQIVFITDGAVGNEKQLLKSIYDNLGSSRLFTVGIGSAPNSYFMRKAAEFGNGTFTHIGNQSEVGEQMTLLFNKLESTVTTNISINWSAQAEYYPSSIGDLYQGEPLIVNAKLEHFPKEITIKGKTENSEWIRTLSLPKKARHKHLSTVWAREKIESIEDKETTGTITESSAKSEILSLALRHKLLSRFTSFVAIEQVVSRPKAASAKANTIPNKVAKGQKFTSIKYPNTATTAELSWWLGLFSATLFIVILRLRNSE